VFSFKHFLVVSDFDQAISFNDSGQILSERLGIGNLREKVDGLASSNFVQQVSNSSECRDLLDSI